MSLSKRGILDDGTFLTDMGSELIKKIKIRNIKTSKNQITIEKVADF